MYGQYLWCVPTSAALFSHWLRNLMCVGQGSLCWRVPSCQRHDIGQALETEPGQEAGQGEALLSLLGALCLGLRACAGLIPGLCVSETVGLPDKEQNKKLPHLGKMPTLAPLCTLQGRP